MIEIAVFTVHTYMAIQSFLESCKGMIDEKVPSCVNARLGLGA